MKSRLTTALLIVTALALPLAAAGWGGGAAEDGINRELRLLSDLDAEQRAALDELRDEHHAAIDDSQNELRALCAAGERNSSRARELRRTIENLHADYLARAREILTNEQLSRLAELDPDNPLVTGEPRRIDPERHHGSGGRSASR